MDSGIEGEGEGWIPALGRNDGRGARERDGDRQLRIAFARVGG